MWMHKDTSVDQCSQQFKLSVKASVPNINYCFPTPLYLIKESLPLYYYYSGYMSCLVLFVQASSGWEEREGNNNFKMKIYVSSRI